MKVFNEIESFELVSISLETGKEITNDEADRLQQEYNQEGTPQNVTLLVIKQKGSLFDPYTFENWNLEKSKASYLEYQNAFVKKSLNKSG